MSYDVLHLADGDLIAFAVEAEQTRDVLGRFNMAETCVTTTLTNTEIEKKLDHKNGLQINPTTYQNIRSCFAFNISGCKISYHFELLG